ncbi:MAG TPA: flavoprotein, partial [Bacillota bacterium]|nr:flavoprotein [Bacillota bacterium]
MDAVCVFGVTGGIAAAKAALAASMLARQGLDVHVIMTESACEFVTPLTFRTLTANPVTV